MSDQNEILCLQAMLAVDSFLVDAGTTDQASQLKALTALLLATRNRIAGMAGQTGARRILKAVDQRPVPKGGDERAAPPGRKF